MAESLSGETQEFEMMTLKTKLTAAQWIDYAVMAALFIFCLKYITYYGKSFAETSVNFQFLNFPVFIGEFLLAVCGILCVIKMCIEPVRFNKWHYLFAGFICFILAKAYWGYIHRGPLALRDAAMFYYIFFAAIAYVCYRPEFFTQRVTFVCYLAMFVLPFDSRFNEYWLMPRIYLGFALMSKFSNRPAAFLLAAALLLTTPYHFFLDTSRSVILGNFLSVVFLIISFGLLRKKQERKMFMGGVFLMLVLFCAYVFYFSGSLRAKGIIAFDRVQAAYQETERTIQERKSSFIPVELSGTLVYNPDSNFVPTEIEPSVKPVSTTGASVVPEAVQVQPSSEEAVILKSMKIGTSVFRILIWQDAHRELFDHKPLFGFDFGKPFRSDKLEIMRWGIDDWQRDGWIAMHNSYLNIIYRAGIVGVAFIVAMAAVFVYCVRIFVRVRSVAGLLLCASLMVPLTAAAFSVTLELPYTAIPIWTLYGLILAYAHRRMESGNNGVVVPQRM